MHPSIRSTSTRPLALTAVVWALLAAPFVGTPALRSIGALPLTGGGFVSQYKVLAPITHNNLTIFPVVADSSHDTSQFLTLDEGLRSGEVVVTEAGKVQPLMRRRVPQIAPRGDQVNQLVLVNNASRPLILLAGEIVTGGKQDRVVAKDRIVPPQSEPIDLSVFCVEPGRWVETASKFTGFSALMAQPSVRKKAMAEKDQHQVWAEVGRAQAGIAGSSSEAYGVGGAVPGRAPAAAPSSYAGAMAIPQARSKVEEVAAPVERSYDKVMRELRARQAVGVVVAVNGDIIWADVFASTALLEKYWPKLVRSYAAEAVTTHVSSNRPDLKSAQAFVDDRTGKREVVESEPGVYSHTEITGNGYRLFELASLLPKTGFDVHIAKMSE